MSYLSYHTLRFYDPKLVGVSKEKCLLVAVDTKLEERRSSMNNKAGQGQGLPIFSLKESLSELSELVGTAGLQVKDFNISRPYEYLTYSRSLILTIDLLVLILT